MKAKKVVLIYLLITALLMTVYADIQIPETIRVGLSFGQSQANIFTLGSDTGVKISIFENGVYKELMSINSSAGIKVRRDRYYNIVNGSESEINYVRAAKYEGDVIGPYHIQIGEVYGDMDAARQMLERVSSVAPSVFLAYEGGWRVWSQLFLDESECQRQIQLMQNEIGDVRYTVIHPDKKRVQITDNATGQLILMLNSDEGIKVAPGDKQGSRGLISYKGKKYRGSIIMQSLPESDITVVNELSLDEYLYSVVPSEMPASWHMEALKAQAIAARNYAIATMGKHKGYGFDLCGTEHCQAYKGVEKESDRTTEAVNATEGKVITYNGKLITAYFHASSGGHTEDSENLWGTKTDYIRGVADQYSLGSPYDSWSLELDRAALKEKLAQANIDLGNIIDVRILEVTPYGRVTRLEIRGTKENMVFEREKIRSILGTTAMKSIWYKLKTDADIFVRGSLLDAPESGRASGMYLVSAAGSTKISGSAGKLSVKGMNGTKAYNAVPGTYIFEGKGFGHGLGMSQYGAKGMAEAGNNYQKILEYYYQGAKVQ